MSGFGGSSSGGGTGTVDIVSPIGAKLKIESLAVTLSTDEPDVPITGTVTANLGSLNGAATSLKQDSQITLLNGGLPTTLGASGGLKIDGSGTALPISGSVTANIGTTNGLALDATLTGGTAQTQTRGGVKGATVAATVTSTANGVDHQGLDVVEQFAPVAEDNTNGVLAEQWKPLSVATYTPTLYTNYAGSITKALISTGVHNAFSFVVTNGNIAVRYLQFHNKATAPVATDVPLLSFPIPAVGSLVLGDQWFTQSGINFSLGLGWAVSTTISPFTDAATASEHTISITYK